MRGRWKNTRRIQDVYTDVNLPYVDARVASIMCRGGAIAYVLNKDSGISNDWLIEHIVPHMAAYGIDPHVCLVLGRALLWALFDETQVLRIPEPRRQQMMHAYNSLGGRNRVPAGENPVQRKALVIVGQDAEVVIDFVDEDINGRDGGAAVASARNNQEVRMLSSHVLQLRHELVEQRAMYERQLAVLRKRLGRIDNNIARIASRPARPLMRLPAVADGPAQQGQQQQPTSNSIPSVPNATSTAQPAEGGGEEEETPALETVEVVMRAPTQSACLGKCPKTLNDLWHEYIFGLTGNKPAKDFTRAERGKVRFTYARRLVFWERCSEMIRMGYTAETAIDKIYTAYANCGSSVTKIINAMMQDRKNKIVREGLREVAL